MAVFELDVNARGITPIFGGIRTGNRGRTAHPVKCDDHFRLLLKGLFHVDGIVNIGNLGFIVGIHQH